ncbi:MAG: class I SAM-dependent methyltransferase, partial [Clostridia bacterium]|nr:class I SAM-dependent methyltransferase [Clostridia bacterium]
MNPDGLAVCAADIRSAPRARAAAETLGVPFAETSAACGGRVLRFAADGVSFVCGGMELKGDLANLARRASGANLREELIVRAAKAKDTPHPRVLDATAGLGEDSFLLAACGCEVTLYERSGAVFMLLEDSLRRAKADPTVSA